MMTERIFNFSAGPAVLPVPVLEEAQRDLLSLPGVGMSVMEISHRSKTFDEIHARAESGVRALEEAKKVGNVNAAATMAHGGVTRIPGNDEISLNPRAADVHITTNETIEGVQWKHGPDTGSVPLIADASADILSHAIPVDKY